MLPGTDSRTMSAGSSGFDSTSASCSGSEPGACCASPRTSFWYSSLRRCASRDLVASTCDASLATLRCAPSTVCWRMLTLSASMHTLSMLCASSNTTMHSFSRSRDTMPDTLGSSRYW